MVENKELYSKMEQALKTPSVEIHAIYEPDGGEFYGNCYHAAVDLFGWQFTFHIYFKWTEAGEMDIQCIERWHFG